MDTRPKLDPLKVIIAQALMSRLMTARNTYSHPTAHYQSRRAPKVRNAFPSKRGDLKRMERLWCEAKVREDRLREEVWHMGEGPKPAWLHSNSRQRHV